MATFTADEITDLATIFEVGSDIISARLTYFASVISDSDKTKALSLVTDWETQGVNFVSVEPKESNKGARINAGDYKDQIRRQIAGLLRCSDLLNLSGGVQGWVYR